MSDPKPVNLSQFAAEFERMNEPRPLSIVNPLTGGETGIVLYVAGPYSRQQDSAREWVVHAAEQHAKSTGKISASAREKMAIGQLARCLTGWKLNDFDEPIPFTMENAERILAGSRFIREQLDAFAASFQPWQTETADAA